MFDSKGAESFDLYGVNFLSRAFLAFSSIPGVGPPPPSPLPKRKRTSSATERFLLFQTALVSSSLQVSTIYNGNPLVALSVVAVHRGHMCQDLRAIESHPIECRVREHVDVVPAQL